MSGSSDHLLNGLQFKFSQSNDQNYNMVEAHHPAHGEVGYMSWANKDTGTHQAGEISYITSYHPHQGVATAIYNHAMNAGYQPTPLHSTTFTEHGGGRQWAKKVGGPSVKPRTYE